MALAHDIANKVARTDDIKINENADFTSLLLSERTLSGLRKSGFRKPSPIQQQAIPIGKCGFDLVIRSKSGTGKTAVFGIIALEMIDLTQNSIQCLIIGPTREIAVQIQGVIETIGSDYEGLKVHSFIGGMPLADDTANLQCCHIAVGAPGRLKHLIESGVLKTDCVKLLVLDEADKLMEQSFYTDINFVYYKLPKCFQMIASSATYPNNLDHYISQYMHTPTHIDALNEETPLLLGLRQFIATVRQTTNSMMEKNRLLLKLISSVTFTQCIVFSNYQTRAESVCNALCAEGFSSEYISAAQTQPERLAALAKLKSFQCRIILSTDLTARGIDASNVDLVVNYDVPSDVCTYLHRMGRAGRYGSRGLCVTLAENGRELDNFKRIIGFLGITIAKLSNTSDWLADDLWKCDLMKYEQICDIVSPIISYDDVQKSLLELRQYKTIKTDNSSNADCSSNEDSSSNAINNPNDCANLGKDDLSTNSTNLCKYSLKEISNFRMDPNLQHNNGAFSKLCDVLEPLIKSSNLNENNVTKILRRNCKLKIKNKGLKNFQVEKLVDFQDVSEDNGSKRKRIAADNSPSNGFMPQEKKNLGTSTENILKTNIGLFNVTQLLCDENVEVSADICENIGQFLNQLKGITDESTSKKLQVTENFKNAKSAPEDINLKFETVESKQKNTEELFKLAFDYAVGENKPHWLEEINEDFDENKFDSSKEVTVKENLLEDFHNVDFDAMECDDEDYDEEDEYIDQNEDEEMEKQPEILETPKIIDFSRFSYEASTSQKNAIPKVSPRKLNKEIVEGMPIKNILDGSKFNKLFMECGGTYLETYKNYEEFGKFKNYWNNWKENVESVREFVQHKIYMKEMNFNAKYNKRFESDDSD